MQQPISIEPPVTSPQPPLLVHATDRYELAPPHAFDEHASPEATVLVPSSPQSRLDAKVLTPALAELWDTASASGVGYSTVEGRDRAALGALVMDGVFALDDGAIRLTGNEALDRLGLDPTDTGTIASPPDVISQISCDAINTVATWSSSATSEELTTALYRSQTLPLDGRARAGLDDRAIERLDAHVWQLWSRPDHSDARTRGWHVAWSVEPPSSVIDKLYVGVHTDDLVDALPRVVAVLAELGAPPWKLGCGPIGVHRPDKLVIYGSSPEHRDAICAALSSTLAPFRPQPVPFTRQFDERGIVSTGTDTPGTELLGVTSSSWRHEVCAEIARGMVVAHEVSCGASSIAEVAMRRLRFVGIDPTTWTPTLDTPEGSNQS